MSIQAYIPVSVSFMRRYAYLSLFFGIHANIRVFVCFQCAICCFHGCVCVCTNEIVYVYMQLKFTWDPQHEAEVRKQWKDKMRVRVKDLVNQALNEDPNKIIP